ncbi:MAG: TPM domain-containing protein, partial [Solibacillus sp.]
MRFLVSIIVCMLVMPLTIMAAIPEKPAYNSYVYDKADVISDDVEQNLIRAAKALEGSTGNVIVMMTIDTIGDLEPYEFGTEVIRKWGIGDAKLN